MSQGAELIIVDLIDQWSVVETGWETNLERPWLINGSIRNRCYGTFLSFYIFSCFFFIFFLFPTPPRNDTIPVRGNKTRVEEIRDVKNRRRETCRRLDDNE